MGSIIRDRRDGESLSGMRESRKPARSLAQVVGLIGGFALVVLGVIALINGGIDTLYAPMTEVAGMEHTPLLAIIEIILGLMLAATAAGAVGSDRSGMTMMGALLLVAGVVVMATHEQLHDKLGVSMGTGFLYAALGAVVLLAAFMAPDVRERVSRSESVEEHDRDVDAT